MTGTDLKISNLRKADEELQIVWGEVYVPDMPDSQDDFMTAEEIRKMAYDFSKKGRLHKIDVQHDNKLYSNNVVETFIARDEDATFIPGSWVIGVHVPSPELWGLIKDGTLNGFSFQALALRQETELEIYIPSEVSGETDEVAGHVHKFVVHFDEDGEFLGGRTDEVDGHFHEIKKGTVSEDADDHNHRFSFVELILDANEEEN